MSVTYRLLLLLYTVLWANFVFRMINAGYTDITIISILLYALVIFSLEAYRTCIINKQP